MNIVKMATKSAWKYGRKTFFIKLLTFFSLLAVLILVNLLVNALNDWIYRSQVYSLPPYTITTFNEDAHNDHYSPPLHVLTLTESHIDSLNSNEKINKDFTFYEFISFSGQIINAENENDTRGVTFIGLDFTHLGEIFPYFDGYLTDSEIALYKSKPSVIVNSRFQITYPNYETNEGDDYIYFGSDFYRGQTAFRFSIEDIDDHPILWTDVGSMATVFIDIQHIKKLALAPDDVVFSAVAVPNKIIPSHGIQNYFATKKLIDVASAQNLTVTSSIELYSGIESTFALYTNLIVAISVIILLILAYTISTNLYIHFQTRQVDFGLYKTFGCTDSNLFLFIFIENICNIGVTVIAVLICNFLISAFVPRFLLLGTVYFIPHLNLTGFLVIIFSAIFIALISVISSYRFVAGQKPYMIFTKRAI